MAIGDVFRRLLGLGKAKSQKEEAPSVPETPGTFVQSFFTAQGVEVSVFDQLDGQRIYRPNKNIDELGEEGLKALVQDIAKYRLIMHDTKKMSIEMRYSTPKLEKANRALDMAIINNEAAQRRVKAIPVLSSSPSNPQCRFFVSEDPTGKRIYAPTAPYDNWGKMTNDQKSQLLEGIILYENEQRKLRGGVTGAGIQINIVGGRQAQAEIQDIYRGLKGPDPRQLSISVPPPPPGPPPPALYKPLIATPKAPEPSKPSVASQNKAPAPTNSDSDRTTHRPKAGH